MKKRIVKVIDNNVEWGFEVSIKQMREDLDRLESEGADTIYIDTIESHGVCSIDIQAIVERLETDEEYENRIKEQKEREEEVRKRELTQLAKLKAKYGE